MVNMGIERLQQLVQQPPSEYASIDCDEESAIAATDNPKFSGDVISYKRPQEVQEGAPTAAPQPHTINVTKLVPTKIP